MACGLNLSNCDAPGGLAITRKVVTINTIVYAESARHFAELARDISSRG